MKSGLFKNKPALLIILMGVILVTYGLFASLSSPGQSTAAGNTALKKPVQDLPVVGSFDNLKKLLVESDANNNRYQRAGNEMMVDSLENSKSMPAPQANIADAAAPTALAGSAPAPQAKLDYSTTNIQVQGVDEADIVKTDGNYIYQVNKDRIVIVKAYPAADMKVVNTIRFEGNSFNPQEIYLDSRHLVVTGTSTPNNNLPLVPMPKLKAPACPPPCGADTAKAIIYDISDKNNIKKVREIEIEGYSVSSRQIGSSLYLVANKYIDFYWLEKGSGDTPSYRDSVQGISFINVDLPKIHYFPGHIYPNYLIVAGINLDKPQEKADIQTYLGSGDNVYASTNNLYVAVNNYAHPIPRPATQGRTSSTLVYRFGLDNGNIKYTGKGEVPGSILNQFAMDEEKGYFRIATTTGEMWRQDENTSKNNIYVLDSNMEIAGRLEGIAPGEKIYSTRFMGDRAYMVTFRQVDPFFVIDMKNPKNPQIIGKLKIPGYSDYLHPYDENHIIGFGKDTVEMKGWDGQNQAFYQGMKIAVFDVTDVNNPQEISKEIIGDRGTDSELLSNHKALLFSRDKHLLAFPVTVAKVNQANLKKQPGNFPAYGSFAFQGAYIYNIDLVNGLKLKGTISHLDASDYQRAGDSWYDSHRNVKRILYINDTLYTISQGMIKANRLSDLQELKALPIE